jgi:hypothetical protein
MDAFEAIKAALLSDRAPRFDCKLSFEEDGEVDSAGANISEEE